MSLSEIGRALGISKATACYHKRRLGVPMKSECARRHDWAEIQRYYDAGHSVRECRAKFGFATKTWLDAVQRGAVISRPRALPLAELLVANQKRGRDNIKMRLLRAGLKESRCEECGIDTWRSKPVSMALHHVNGDKHDNRLENLVLLCPNCHSQTENFGVKNWKERRSIGANAA